MEKIKKGDLILLISKEKRILTRAGAVLTNELGKIETEKIIGKSFGEIIKSSKGHAFFVVQPNLPDMLEHAARGPQVVCLKDAAALAGAVGLRPGWNVLDAGAGSGFLAMYLANAVSPGRVISYEKRKEFYEIAKKNANKFSINNLEIKNEDIFAAKERDLDLITLDFEDSPKFVKYAYEMLKPGGWLAIYSLHIERIQAAFAEMKKSGFSEIRVFETLQRDWQIEGEKKTFTRPKTQMLGHTGWWIIGRKT